MLEGKTVGNLLGGVSQQPDSQRFSNMASASLNAWPSPLEGLSKRPGVERIASALTGYPTASVRLHTIERDGREWYAIVLVHAEPAWVIKAFDINPDSANYGDEVPILDSLWGGTGLGGYSAWGNGGYLAGATIDNRDLSILTVADTTFVANHTQAVAMTSAVEGAAEEKGFATVRAGAYGQQYGVALDGDAHLIDLRDVNAAWGFGKTPPGDDAKQSQYIAPNRIADKIEEAIDAGPGAKHSCDPLNWPTSIGKFRLRVYGAGSGNFKLKIYYRQAGDTAVQNWTTGNIAYNAGLTAVDTALSAVGSPFVSAANWVVTEAQSGQGIAVGFDIQFAALVAGDSLIDMVSQDVTLGSTATVFAVARKQNVLEIERINQAAFDLEPLDSARGVNILVAKDYVTSMSELPTTCRDGFMIEVNPTPDEEDGETYFVKFETKAGTGDFNSGKWVENVGFDMKTTIDAATMPHAMVSKVATGTAQEIAAGLSAGDAYFFAEPFAWEDRTAGDDESNAAPSFFAGAGTITGMAYYRGRLILFSGDSVCCSEAGNPANLFRTTVAGGLIDSDRIDLVSQLPTAAAIQSGLELQESMVLFSDVAQMRVTTDGETLTPSTAGITTVSNYRYDGGADPVAAEFFGYFGFRRGANTGIRQIWDSSNGSATMFRAADITDHVSTYIEGAIEELAVSTAVNALAVLTDARDTIYIYRWEDNGQDRVQSAWQKFQFSTGDVIAGIGFAGSRLILAVRHYDGDLDLEVIDLADAQTHDDADYAVRLDRRIDETVPTSIIFATGVSTVTLPAGYRLRAGESLVAFERHVAGQQGGVYQSVEATANGQQVFVFNGDLSSKKYFFGLNYTKRHRLSRVFLDGAASGRPTPEITGRTQIRRAVMDVSRTGYVRFEVTRRLGSPPSIKTIDGYNPEAGVTLESTQFTVPIQARSDGYVLEIVNDSPFPSNIVSLEYELQHSSRSARRGR